MSIIWVYAKESPVSVEAVAFDAENVKRVLPPFPVTPRQSGRVALERQRQVAVVECEISVND